MKTKMFNLRSFTTCILLLLLFAGLQAIAQEDYNREVPREMVVIKSTKSYKAALSIAKQAAASLHKELNLRYLIPNKKTGLTLSRSACKSGLGDDEGTYPFYRARGDGAAADDDYISVEYSSGYKGFVKGYYIVVAAINKVNSDAIKTELANVKKVYPGAYAKRTYLWYGSLHE